MAFCAQLTEQGHAQDCQEQEKVKRSCRQGGGIDPSPLTPLSSPSKRFQLYMLQEQTCVNLPA